MTATAESLEAVGSAVGEVARKLDVRVAVAESLTGGLVASTLAAAPQSSEWFSGGIVAYASDVKHALLGVPAGPVVSSESAVAMASSASRLFGAEFAVSLTGVGGPDPQDGQPPGTVHLAVASPTGVREHKLMLSGEPEEICRQATWSALQELQGELQAALGSRQPAQA